MLLLRKQKPGSSIPLESLTASDNQYIPNGRTAIIASDGMSASASISRLGSFALTSEKPVVSVTPSKITVAVGQRFNSMQTFLETELRTWNGPWMECLEALLQPAASGPTDFIPHLGRFRL